jgi:hypothetical protein
MRVLFMNLLQQLERSRSKFKRFAAKYEREIEQVSRGRPHLRSESVSISWVLYFLSMQRDRRIEQLQGSSQASSFVSPDARSSKRSHSSSSSSSSSSRSRRRPMDNSTDVPSTPQ